MLALLLACGADDPAGSASSDGGSVIQTGDGSVRGTAGEGGAAQPPQADGGGTSGGTTGGTTGGKPAVDAGTGPVTTAGWLHTQANKIVDANGKVWHGRGANIHDTRSCDACTFEAANVGEVNRRVDELVGNWHATFLRLVLESYATSGGRVQWKGVLDDPAYLDQIKTIIAHAKTKPGVYVLVTVWLDPSIDAMGWPTAKTNEIWTKLADVFKNDGNVLFGIINEPQLNNDGALDSQVWDRMNSAVAAIRAVETKNGTPQHLIAVQGTRGWARYLTYYVTHPITAGGGKNIVYETHVYDPKANFKALFEDPSLTLPVIIGEYGEEDPEALWQSAEARDIPYLAWTFHMRCSPSLITDSSGGGCGVGMNLQPTAWGTKVKTHLATPW